ncbi:hypothetical protein VTN77DRAFT_73 [Rasamsonia byssochlamydoides]|uniref:uncharacterized protein n=1 Tax=Rasamsonia byssochlamydoides TaxID=89139 RepID=UPI00374444FD
MQDFSAVLVPRGFEIIVLQSPYSSWVFFTLVGRSAIGRARGSRFCLQSTSCELSFAPVVGGNITRQRISIRPVLN